MSGVGPKHTGVEARRMDTNDRQYWTGICVLLIAGVVLFGSVALGLPYEQIAAAFAVLGLAGGAYLIGTADDGRPV